VSFGIALFESEAQDDETDREQHDLDWSLLLGWKRPSYDSQDAHVQERIEQDRQSYSAERDTGHCLGIGPPPPSASVLCAAWGLRPADESSTGREKS
jgi:hypothetical protein